MDGIGSTEMLHIYCSNRPGDVEPGTTGAPCPATSCASSTATASSSRGRRTGALQVRGDSCAAYYWHQHEKTKNSMLGDWFATGDRYARRVDGAYSYVGRVDDMLKVGGLWVSPVDMEHALIEHPRVAGIGVVGVNIDGATRIAAYVECGGEPGDDSLADELRTWCKARMRRYEYPHVVTFVDELPRTLTGKVQRFRLREWAAETLRRSPGPLASSPLRAPDSWVHPEPPSRPGPQPYRGGQRRRRTHVRIACDYENAPRSPPGSRRNFF